MALSWSGRRKLLYATVTILFLGGLLLYVAVRIFSTPPTCFDGIQNGNEAGIDCGGSCSLVCANAVKPLQVEWARAFPSGAKHTYTLAASITNPNGNIAARQVGYVFQAYDADNRLLLQQEGVMEVPPVQSVPVVVPSVNTGERAIARVVFSFNDGVPVVWNTVPLSRVPHIRVVTQTLASDATRLDVVLRNDSLFDAPHVRVVALLYDEAGVARAASSSFVDRILQGDTATAVFTWPVVESVAHPAIARAEIIVLPSF